MVARLARRTTRLGTVGFALLAVGPLRIAGTVFAGPRSNLWSTATSIRVPSLATGAPDEDCTFLEGLGIRDRETVVVGSFTISSEQSDQDQQRRYAVAGFAYLDSNNDPIFSPRS